MHHVKMCHRAAMCWATHGSQLYMKTVSEVGASCNQFASRTAQCPVGRADCQAREEIMQLLPPDTKCAYTE